MCKAHAGKPKRMNCARTLYNSQVPSESLESLSVASDIGTLSSTRLDHWANHRSIWIAGNSRRTPFSMFRTSIDTSFWTDCLRDVSDSQNRVSESIYINFTSKYRTYKELAIRAYLRVVARRFESERMPARSFSVSAITNERRIGSQGIDIGAHLVYPKIHIVCT